MTEQLTNEDFETVMKMQKLLKHRADTRESERCYEKHYGLFQLTQMARVRLQQFSVQGLRFPELIGYKYGAGERTIEVVFDAKDFDEITYNGQDLLQDAYDLMNQRMGEFSEDDEVVEVQGRDDQILFKFLDGKYVTYNRDELTRKD